MGRSWCLSKYCNSTACSSSKTLDMCSESLMKFVESNSRHDSIDLVLGAFTCG